MNEISLIIYNLTLGKPKDLIKIYKTTFYLVGGIILYFLFISNFNKIYIIELLVFFTTFSLLFYNLYKNISNIELKDKKSLEIQEDCPEKEQCKTKEVAKISKKLPERILKRKSPKERLFYFDDLLEETYKTGTSRDMIKANREYKNERNNYLS